MDQLVRVRLQEKRLAQSIKDVCLLPIKESFFLTEIDFRCYLDTSGVNGFFAVSRMGVCAPILCFLGSIWLEFQSIAAFRLGRISGASRYRQCVDVAALVDDHQGLLIDLGEWD